MANLANIKKNDTVFILTGKDSGKSGKVLKVMIEEQKVVVENINVAKKHQKAKGNIEAGIVEKNMPIHISNVMPICPKCGEKTSFRRKEIESGKRVRFCKECGATLD